MQLEVSHVRPLECNNVSEYYDIKVHYAHIYALALQFICYSFNNPSIETAFKCLGRYRHARDS
jgi:hypothetical protein